MDKFKSILNALARTSSRGQSSSLPILAIGWLGFYTIAGRGRAANLRGQRVRSVRRRSACSPRGSARSTGTRASTDEAPRITVLAFAALGAFVARASTATLQLRLLNTRGSFEQRARRGRPRGMSYTSAGLLGSSSLGTAGGTRQPSRVRARNGSSSVARLRQYRDGPCARGRTSSPRATLHGSTLRKLSRFQSLQLRSRPSLSLSRVQPPSQGQNRRAHPDLACTRLTSPSLHVRLASQVASQVARPPRTWRSLARIAASKVSSLDTAVVFPSTGCEPTGVSTRSPVKSCSIRRTRCIDLAGYTRDRAIGCRL